MHNTLVLSQELYHPSRNVFCCWILEVLEVHLVSEFKKKYDINIYANNVGATQFDHDVSQEIIKILFQQQE